jgi:hypothetical protein
LLHDRLAVASLRKYLSRPSNSSESSAIEEIKAA